MYLALTLRVIFNIPISTSIVAVAITILTIIMKWRYASPISDYNVERWLDPERAQKMDFYLHVGLSPDNHATD